MKPVRFFLLWANAWFGGLFQYKYGKEWDARLQYLLATESPRLGYRGFVILFGQAEVWTGNPIYAFGYDYGARERDKRRPSLKTMYQLWKLREDLLSERGRA